MNILDSHIHFFDPTRAGGVEWPDVDSSLYLTTLPSNLVTAMKSLRLTACIVVETSRRPEDDKWLLDLAVRESLIHGAVLNLQPDQPGFESRLASVLAIDEFLGIRLRPIERYDLSRTKLQKSLSLLEQAGKTIEFGAKCLDKKRDFARLAQRYPGTTWILDHCGHPQNGGQPDDDWRAGIELIAKSPNTVAKVSGLDGKLDDWRATLDVLVNLFGVERLLYGSNWPVCTQHENYENQIAALTDYFGGNAAGFFSANAERVYGIGSSDN